jgi:outer membrane protein assembly factor BamB
MNAVVKVILRVLALFVVMAWGLYQFAGLRVNVDGSGKMPRFFSMGPDYDALEADRARQREAAPPPATAEALPVSSLGGAQDAVAPPVAASADAAPVLANAPPRAVEPGRGSWPDFRGPSRDGRYRGDPIRTTWPNGGLPELWRHPIGIGYASFVVAEGRAFTIEQRRAREVVAAYDVETGRELWTASWDGEFREAMGGDGPRATPTYHDGRVYALGALGELQCLDAQTGKLHWRRNILEENDAGNLPWGMSAAPLVVDDLVIVLPGGQPEKSVVAYDRLTGERRWSVLGDQQAYTSPMLVTLGGLRQLLVVSAYRAMGLTVENGDLLWDYSWSNPQGINVAQPLILDGDRIFLSASYGNGAAMFQVTRDGNAFRTKTLWKNQRIKNRFTSSVLHEGHIYGLDESILTCIDAATGEARWKAGRYGYGQVMIAGDRLIVLTEDGTVVQVRATPERHEEIASFAAISGKTWNHPVIVDGRLLLRNGSEMAAFDIRE